MLPYISIFGFTISLYGVCMATAFLICLLLFARRMKLIGWTFEQSTVMAVAIMLCSLIGAFFLHRLIAAVDNTSASEGSGFVLYGGIIAGTMSCIFLCKIKGVNVWKVMDEIASIVPLAQGIGRVGCFVSGCCYGKQTNGLLHIIYSHPGSRAPQGIPLIPVQIYEAMFDVLLFLFLSYGLKKERTLHLTSVLYLLLYSTFRFIIEFFRGDAVRGIWGGLSTSQWISLMFLPMILFFFVRLWKNCRANK